LRRDHVSQFALSIAEMAAILLCLVSSLAAQTGAHYDHQIQAYVHNGDFSGSALVARDGRILFQKSYGMANHEWGIPNSEKTKFHVASVTKTFTAAAILQLERAGKLKLDDPLSKYVPDFLNGDRITIEQMLTHTSGLPDFYSLPEYPLRKYQRVTLPDLVAWVKTKPLDFFPGSKSSYSNTGYAFLAFIIEQVSGKPYEQFLAEEILKLAGMKETGAFRDDVIIPNRATGYQPSFEGHGLRNAPAYDKTILTGSGSLYSTTADLYEWCRVVEGNKFFNVHEASRAYGWGARETKTKHKYIEQSGRDPGFSSHIALFPDDRLIVIVLGNLEDAAVNTLADDLAAIALGEDPAVPAPRTKVAAPVAHPEEFAGTYEVNPKFLLDLRTEDSKLYLRGTGGDYLPLEPTGKDAFFYRQLYVKVGFRRDKNGKIEALLWNGDYPCKKLSDKPQP
jgi:CubicO group peptidase (beta-lactamase class C family)